MFDFFVYLPLYNLISFYVVLSNMVVTWTVVRPFDYLHGPLSFIYNMMIIIKMLHLPITYFIYQRKNFYRNIYMQREQLEFELS